MELTALEAEAVKAIYTLYHANAIHAEQALEALELIINGEEETE
jgi:hypothetical protein